jgi:hypothetical protein
MRYDLAHCGAVSMLAIIIVIETIFSDCLPLSPTAPRVSVGMTTQA